MKNFLITALSAIVFWSCTKDEITPQEQSDEVAVTFNVSDAQPVETRAGDNDLTDIQLLLTGPAGRYYFRPGSANFIAKIRQGIYEIYATANFSGSIEHLDADDFPALSADYSMGGGMSMSFRGAANFTSENAMNYTVKLIRAVAKFQVNITAMTGVTIRSWQICHKPTGAALFENGVRTEAFDNSERMPISGNNFVVYVPENLAGTAHHIADQRQRTAANAPRNATYLRLEGTLANGSPIEYRIYLGGNETNDFNIRRNHNYRVDINIVGNSVTDLRILSYAATHTIKAQHAPGSDLLTSNVVYFEPSFMTSTPEIHPKINFKYTFTGHPSGKLSVVLNGRLVSNSEFSGILRPGEKLPPLLMCYEQNIFTPENNIVRYKLTFTDARGNITEYKGALKFANKMTVYVVGQDNSLETKPLKGKIILPYGEPFSCTEDGTYNIYFLGDKINMTASPALPAYGFFCWSGDPGGQARISFDPTIEIEVKSPVAKIFALFR